MVDWSCKKEILNERGPYIFAEWPCANKRKKSVGTLNSGRRVAHITSAKILTIQFLWATCPTISHRFLLLSSQWMSSLDENDALGPVPGFILLFLCFCVNQEN